MPAPADLPAPAVLPAPRAIGVILPSSNRMVERVTHHVLASRPGVDACFTRVPYANHPPDGYDLAVFRRAAEMLAQARPDVIVWNATRGALLGFEPDRQLAAMIELDTGIACTTTSLATVDLLRATNRRRIGLVAQGDAGDGRRLIENFQREGIHIVAAHHLGIRDNFAAADVTPAEITDHARRLAAGATLDAVLVWSTNLAGYRVPDPVATGGAAGPGVPVLDSATIGVHAALSHLRTALLAAEQA